MTKITLHEDDTISPEKQFVLDFNVAFANGDMASALQCFSNDVTWDVAGHEPVTGIVAVTQMLGQMDEVADELVVERVLQEGNTCVLSGSLTYDGKTMRFCDMYTLSSPTDGMKISKLTGFAVDLDDEN